MNDSRCNNKVRLLVSAAFVGACLLPGAAFALSASDPTPIGLPQGQQPASPPPQDQPAPATNEGIGSAPLPPLPVPQDPAPQEPGQQPQPQPTQPVATEPVPQATPQAAPAAASSDAPGLLDDSNAGLGANIWQGSSGAKLTTLVPKLPAPQTQPSLRDLQLRLLLTKAAGPNAGQGIDTLVPLRAERLHAMGFSAEAMMVAQSTGNAAPVDARAAFEKALSDQDATTACAKADEVAAGQQILELYWRKALLYCQIERDQDTAATLGLDLLRESGDKEAHTKDFIALAAALLGQGKIKKVKLAGKPDELIAAMMRKAGLKPKDVAAAAPQISGLAAAAAAARDEKVPLPKRIEAGELAFAGGLVSVDELIGLYRQAKFTGDPLSMPDSPLMRAQLYQAADQAFDPVRRAQYIQRALLNAKARGAYFAQGALYRPLADRVTPAPNLAWFAPEAARLMFWSGNVDRGGFWLNLAQGSGAANPEVARAVPSLQVLGQMAGLAGGDDADPIATWQQMGGNPATAEKLRGINAGLGLPGGAANGAGGDAAAIGEAAQTGRRGETVLLALVALGGKGLASVDGGTLAQALGGLNAVGLQDEARRIGLEAAILAGL